MITWSQYLGGALLFHYDAERDSHLIVIAHQRLPDGDLTVLRPHLPNQEYFIVFSELAVDPNRQFTPTLKFVEELTFRCAAKETLPIIYALQ